MPKSAVKSYKMWIAMFPESFDGSTLDLFYMFVHVLLAHSKKERSSYWLEQNLKEDCPELTYEDIEKYCDLYTHLKAFKNVRKSQTAKLIAMDIHEKNMEEARKKFS